MLLTDTTDYPRAYGYGTQIRYIVLKPDSRPYHVFASPRKIEQLWWPSTSFLAEADVQGAKLRRIKMTPELHASIAQYDWSYEEDSDAAD